MHIIQVLYDTQILTKKPKLTINKRPFRRHNVFQGYKLSNYKIPEKEINLASKLSEATTHKYFAFDNEYIKKQINKEGGTYKGCCIHILEYQAKLDATPMNDSTQMYTQYDNGINAKHELRKRQIETVCAAPLIPNMWDVENNNSGNENNNDNSKDENANGYVYNPELIDNNEYDDNDEDADNNDLNTHNCNNVNEDNDSNLTNLDDSDDDSDLNNDDEYEDDEDSDLNNDDEYEDDDDADNDLNTYDYGDDSSANDNEDDDAKQANTPQSLNITTKVNTRKKRNKTRQIMHDIIHEQRCQSVKLTNLSQQLSQTEIDTNTTHYEPPLKKQRTQL